MVYSCKWRCNECHNWFTVNNDYPLLTEDNVKVCADCFYLIKHRKELECSLNEDEDYDSERYYTV